MDEQTTRSTHFQAKSRGLATETEKAAIHNIVNTTSAAWKSTAPQSSFLENY
jgi:hypothetical protein